MAWLEGNGRSGRVGWLDWTTKAQPPQRKHEPSRASSSSLQGNQLPPHIHVFSFLSEKYSFFFKKILQTLFATIVNRLKTRHIAHVPRKRS